jgi:hypothetical protein
MNRVYRDLSDYRYLPASPTTYSDWVHRDFWKVLEAACLLSGYYRDEHHYSDDPLADLPAIREIVPMETALRNAIDQEQLLPEGMRPDGWEGMPPLKWVELAHNRGLPVPEGLAKFFPNGKPIFERLQELEQTSEPPATLRVLGALLSWLKEDKTLSQAAITKAIEFWKGERGLGKTVIARVFAAANKGVSKGATPKE